MMDLVVVVGNPPLGLLAHLGGIAEDVHVEHAASKAAIDSFDETMVHEPARLDEVQRDAFAFRPSGQSWRDELRPVVQAQLGWVAVPGGDAFQRADDARGRQVEIDFDRQRLAAEAIDDVSGHAPFELRQPDSVPATLACRPSQTNQPMPRLWATSFGDKINIERPRSMAAPILNLAAAAPDDYYDSIGIRI